VDLANLASQIESLVKAKKSHDKIMVHAPTKLSRSELEIVSSYLKKTLRIEAPIVFILDKSVIAGIKIIYRDLQLDYSLKGRLARLAKEIE